MALRAALSAPSLARKKAELVSSHKPHIIQCMMHSSRCPRPYPERARLRCTVWCAISSSSSPFRSSSIPIASCHHRYHRSHTLLRTLSTPLNDRRQSPPLQSNLWLRATRSSDVHNVLDTASCISPRSTSVLGRPEIRSHLCSTRFLRSVFTSLRSPLSCLPCIARKQEIPRPSVPLLRTPPVFTLGYTTASLRAPPGKVPSTRIVSLHKRASAACTLLFVARCASVLACDVRSQPQQHLLPSSSPTLDTSPISLRSRALNARCGFHCCPLVAAACNALTNHALRS